MKVYAILPAAGAPAEEVLMTMVSLQKSSIPTIYVHREEEVGPVGPDMLSLRWDGKTVGSLIELVRSSVPADYFLWIPPGVVLQPHAEQHFLKAFADFPKAGLYLSNYLLNDQEIELCPLRGDITEREDMGVAWGVSTEMLEQIGGVDTSLDYTTFYDLRLKLMEAGELVHLEQPVFSMDVEEEADSSASKLFFPGKGAYGGFSYLFMNPEEEKETEEVLYRCLKRRGAWREDSNGVFDEEEWDKKVPIASVVIPVYNRAKYLPYAIESVQKGKLQNFEIIVIDNASTDATRDVAEQLAEKDPRITVLHNEINLIARALNMGIETARGKYIAQLDSDDEYTVDTLQSMVTHLESHPRCGLAISYYELMDEEGTSLEEFGVIKHLEYNRNNILRVDGAGAVRVWRKAAILESGGFNDRDFPNYGEDYDLVLKVGEKYEVDRVHEVLYRYRRHPGNTDALRRHPDKIAAKTLARTRAITRRRILNGYND